jgi:hypothetical protein
MQEVTNQRSQINTEGNLMTSSLVQFEAEPDMISNLTARLDPARGESLGDVASRGLKLHYHLMAIEAQKADLAYPEALALVTVISGTSFWEPRDAAFIWMSVEDHFSYYPLTAPDGLDVPAFVAKLKAMSDARSQALCDAIERWWLLADRGSDDRCASFEQAGLIATAPIAPANGAPKNAGEARQGRLTSL